ncbi:DUF262 domain-containing protein [Acidovorax radicis]|uniref:DUF262 domain-containing protein n=1 Tax=Acidovorax radicis TaxID=758826 RepID=UPI001CF86AA3|nr:DUF262 domain-containing protein [Acidovorax radicis]UCU97963.1 DUF262 domain-containing protein [Acidovorax radicis]
MSKYKVQSVTLLDLVNDVRAGRLVPDAYFQRNLVWREIHKKDLIQTILLGYPFPPMFFSRGKIDVESMKATSCIVDGQQRTNAITEFIDNKFPVNGRFFKELETPEKETLLKFEIAVVMLDMPNDSPDVLEIFKRLNRTANSLTTIERLASEYSSTEYMYVARLLANDVDLNPPKDAAEEEDWKLDPNLPPELIAWAKTKKPSSFEDLISQLSVFSDREIARKVHLMYLLNIMSTLLGGFFNRNEKTTTLLDDYKDFFPEKDNTYELVSSALISATNLQIERHSFWSTKANFFSLVVAIAKRLEVNQNIDYLATRSALLEFAAKPDAEYTLAAKEAVNNKKERQIRHQRIATLLKG